MAWLDAAVVSLIVLLAAGWSGRKLYVAFRPARGRGDGSGCGSCKCASATPPATQSATNRRVGLNIDESARRGGGTHKQAPPVHGPHPLRGPPVVDHRRP